MLVSTKRISVVEFVPAEVVGGIETDATGTEFLTKLLLLAGKALELRLGRFADREADEEVLKQRRDGGGLLGSLHAGLPVEVVINADSDVFHGWGTFSQFHSPGKLKAGSACGVSQCPRKKLLNGNGRVKSCGK